MFAAKKTEPTGGGPAVSFSKVYRYKAFLDLEDMMCKLTDVSARKKLAWSSWCVKDSTSCMGTPMVLPTY